MRIAIVGSRRRNAASDKARVVRLVDNLQMSYRDLTIVSGGCRGVDSWAIEAARTASLQTLVFLPNISDGMQRFELARAMYARNREIAAGCDQMFAFVAADRSGGTENAIWHALDLGKRVTIVPTTGRMWTIEPEPKPATAQAALFER